MRLAFVDELLCFVPRSTGDRRDDGIFRVVNGSPVLAGDIRGGKDSPSTDTITHDAHS